MQKLTPPPGSVIGEQKRVALDVISEACETYQCSKVFALFSGGDDSTASLRVAVEHPKFVAAVTMVTGVGVEASLLYARETCKKLRVPLIEYHAVENVQADGTPEGDHPLVQEIYPEGAWTWHRLTGRTQTNTEKAEVLLTRRAAC